MTVAMQGSAVRSGWSYWFDSYLAMVRFELINLRIFLASAMLVQVLTGAGMAYMYGFYMGDIPATAQLFIVTGIPALALVPIGLVMVPGSIMIHKIRDTYDFVWSLPVPRMTSAAATFTVFTGLALPGTIISLLLADLYYGVDLAWSWSLIPALLLTSLMSTSVGFGMAHAIPEPRFTNLLTNIVIFMAILFAPIVVPIAQFPDWWASVHRVLPFYHMAQVIRDSLSNGLVESVGTSWAVLGAWIVGAWLLAGWVVGRRK
ncbi:MAG: ABC transporter permease [Actinomycetota bacterium]|nr:ABC transporter permease [Actinomycetota bacterium]